MGLLLLASLHWAWPNATAQPANGIVRFEGESDVNSPFERWRQLWVNWVDVTSPATVTLRVIGGTLLEGQDFTIDPKVLSSPPSGYSWSTFDISLKEGLVNGRLNGAPATVELSLVDPTGGVTTGSPNHFVVALGADPSVWSFYLPLYDFYPRLVWRHDGQVEVKVERHGPPWIMADIDYATEPATAQPGLDYVPVSGTLHFGAAPQDNAATFTVPILTNNPTAGDVEFRVALSNPTAGHVLGSPSILTVRIQNDAAGFALRSHFDTNAVFVQVPDIRVPENAGQALVDVVILGDTNTRPVSVDYRTEPSSATPFEDYTPVSGTLTFAPGETRQTIAIPIINDSRAGEYWRGFRLLLENPTGGLLLSRPREVWVGIEENDLGYFIGDTYPALSDLVLDERAGTLTIHVHRVGDYDFASSVHYRVARDAGDYQRGTAVPGLDFVPIEGTLSFGPNETNQTFTLSILDDGAISGDKEFYIILDQPTGDISVATPTVRVILLDSDRNPVHIDPDFQPDWPALTEDAWDPQVAVQPAGGKILLVTPADRVTGEDGVLLLRLLPDGQRDPAWEPAAIIGNVRFLLLQTNGQVLIAADSNPPQYWGAPMEVDPDFSVNGLPQRHLARLNANGSLDTAFVPSLATNLAVSALALQPDAHILVALSGPSTNGLFRLNPSGAADPAFHPPPGLSPSSIFVAPDGGIILGSYSPIRLNRDGSQDTNFSPPGDVSILAIQADGRLLVGWFLNDVRFLGRLTTQGPFDATFAPFSVEGYLYQVLPAANAKLWLLKNYIAGGSGSDFQLVRLQSDGTEDPTWPVATIHREVDAMGSAPFELHELPDGNLLLATVRNRVNGQPRAGLVRLRVNVPLPRVEVDRASALVPENGGKLAINLLRCGTNTEPITVTWRTEGGTAKPGVDYLPASGTLTFPAHESVASIELEVFDNAVPDADRTVRLRLQGPPPSNQEYPPIELTIANDDLGFPPGGIKHFPNGRVWLRPTGGWGFSADRVSWSDNLRDWTNLAPDPGWWNALFLNPEVIDKTAPTNAVRFYRLRLP